MTVTEYPASSSAAPAFCRAAWGAMMLISWFQGQFLETLGLARVELFITLCFFAGSAMLYIVQKRTVFSQSASGTQPLN